MTHTMIYAGAPRSTPWGCAQHRETYAPGIVWVSTASHGGFLLSHERNAAVPDYMRDSAGAYEEDCDWCIVALVFETEFLAHEAGKGRDALKQILQARDTLRNWHPLEYQLFFGVGILPGDSYRRDQERFDEAHRNALRVTSAFGSWAHWVPQGMVGVCATIGGRSWTAPERMNPRGKERWFLVPEAEYAARGRHDFIIDEARHHEFEQAPNLV